MGLHNPSIYASQYRVGLKLHAFHGLVYTDHQRLRARCLHSEVKLIKRLVWCALARNNR